MVGMFSSPAPAQAKGADSPDNPGTETIVYADVSSLPGATVQINRGTANGDSCLFEISGFKSTTDGTVEVIRELSFDPSTCTQTLARAAYPKNDIPVQVKQLIGDDDASASRSGMATASAPAVEANRVNSDADPNASSIVKEDSGGALRGTVSYTAKYKAMTRDPVNLITTSSQTILTWQVSNGNLVTSYDGSGVWTWLAQTGWVKLSSSAIKGLAQTNVPYVDSTAQYQNATFCNLLNPLPGPSTCVNHSKTRVDGNITGGFVYGATITKSGGCADLLHYDYAVG